MKNLIEWLQQQIEFCDSYQKMYVKCLDDSDMAQIWDVRKQTYREVLNRIKREQNEAYDKL